METSTLGKFLPLWKSPHLGAWNQVGLWPLLIGRTSSQSGKEAELKAAGKQWQPGPHQALLCLSITVFISLIFQNIPASLPLPHLRWIALLSHSDLEPRRRGNSGKCHSWHWTEAAMPSGYYCVHMSKSDFTATFYRWGNWDTVCLKLVV